MRRFGILIAIIVIVIALWTGAWFWAAGTASAYVKSLETADGVSTPRVTCADFSITGYPFGLDATCTDATIVSSDTTVTVAGVKATILVYNPFHVLAFARSPLTYDDAFTGSRGRLDFADMEASGRLTGWRVGRVSVVVNQPVLNDTVLEDRLIAKAAKAEFHLVDDAQKHDAAKGLAALEEYVKIDGLNAPMQKVANGSLTLEAEITGLPDDVRSYGEGDLVKRWQVAGGEMQIVSLKGEDGADNFSTQGTLGLDEMGRVKGQLAIVSMGVVERLGPMIPEDFKWLVLGAQAADGSYSQTLNIAAGVVFSGLVPMGMIPPVW
ncbi:MAG TPA: DUF2125 domain-containing protein [Devosia sp.]|nr:DUF2125 domain-containing protein [Devosia sp.]